MRESFFLISLIMASWVWAQNNVEVNARYVKDNENFIYMESKTDSYKIKKSELTKEGVKQILQNKDKNLTLFIPESSIVKKKPKE